MFRICVNVAAPIGAAQYRVKLGRQAGKLHFPGEFSEQIFKRCQAVSASSELLPKLEAVRQGLRKNKHVTAQVVGFFRRQLVAWCAILVIVYLALGHCKAVSASDFSKRHREFLIAIGDFYQLAICFI